MRCEKWTSAAPPRIIPPSAPAPKEKPRRAPHERPTGLESRLSGRQDTKERIGGIIQ